MTLFSLSIHCSLYYIDVHSSLGKVVKKGILFILHWAKPQNMAAVQWIDQLVSQQHYNASRGPFPSSSLWLYELERWPISPAWSLIPFHFSDYKPWKGSHNLWLLQFGWLLLVPETLCVCFEVYTVWMIFKLLIQSSKQENTYVISNIYEDAPTSEWP